MSQQTNSKYNKAVGLFLLGFTLAFGFIGAAWILVKGAHEVVNYDQRITVKGYAERSMKSNLAIWKGQYSVTQPDLSKAYQEIKQKLPTVLEHIVSQGIDKGEIESLGITKKTNYQRNEKGVTTDKIISYTFTQNFRVKSTKVSKVAILANRFSQLLEKGINASSSSPKYFYTKASELKLEMLKEATGNARRRAEMLVVGGSDKVGRLRSARQGVFQITAEHSNSVSGYGVFDTSSINKVIKAIVTIEFTIQ